MQVQEVNSFLNYVSEVEAFGGLFAYPLFRGQGRLGNLLPGIARRDPKVDTVEKEREMLRELRLMGASFVPPHETDLDLLVRAQHFGLKTRLLDWTSNPLTALWFACASEKSGDVHVHSLWADDLLLRNDAYDDDPFLIDSTRVLRPRLNNPRVIAQGGWFTLHRYSQQSRCFVALEKNVEMNQSLHCYKIPASQRDPMLHALNRLGIGARTLQPDLGGVCSYLNWQLSTT